MTWASKLRSWNISNADSLGEVLEENVGISPYDFKNPVQLYYYLSNYMRTIRPGQSLIFEECWSPTPPWYCIIVIFLNEVYTNYLAPYIPYIGIMVLGGVASWLLPSKWKIIGVAAVGAGMVMIYQMIAQPEGSA